MGPCWAPPGSWYWLPCRYFIHLVQHTHVCAHPYLIRHSEVGRLSLSNTHACTLPFKDLHKCILVVLMRKIYDFYKPNYQNVLLYLFWVGVFFVLCKTYRNRWADFDFKSKHSYLIYISYWQYLPVYQCPILACTTISVVVDVVSPLFSPSTWCGSWGWSQV